MDLQHRTAALHQQAHVSIFENSPDCVKILDLDGNLLSMNTNGQCVMEIDDFGAVCGELWPSLWPADTRAEVHRAMEVARSGSIGQFQAFCPTAKGTPKWWDVVVSPLLGSDGTLQGLVSISRDITEHRQAAERERHLASRLRFALETAHYGEWDFDEARTQFHFNRQFALCFALPDMQQQCTFEQLLQQVHADDRAMLATAIAAARHEARELDLELRVPTPQSATTSVRWLHLRGNRYLQADHNSRNSSLTGLVSDITGRMLSTEALRQAYRLEQESVSVLEREVSRLAQDQERMWRLSTSIMLAANFENRIISVNPAWGVVLGYDAAQAPGLDFLTLVHPDDRAATVAEVARLAKGLTTLGFENRYRHADGSYRNISWSAVPDSGQMHAVGRDITEEKQAAEALRRTEQALRQSQKLESIGKLTGGVAHDFNNVLQIITGNLQLLQLRLGDQPDIRKRLDAAEQAVDRGGKLAAQLLAFARRQPLKPMVTDLRKLIDSMDDMLRRAIGESVEVALSVEAGLWHTLVDPNQLENVLLNLAINARDAMQGQGRLTIELSNAELDTVFCQQHQELQPGQYVRLAVSDTGCGIAPDVVTHIFEPFFTTKPEGEGTGLGLSMAYGFVKQSGGHIQVYSEIGHGTTFKLYLPRSHANADSVQMAQQGPVSGGSETILVVEDDLHVQDTVVALLRDLGYTVLKANDAQSALSIVQSGMAIDLLFTDVVMPGELRSPELARQATAALPGLAVLFTSGYTQNAFIHAGRLEPGVELLSKPYRREDLANKLRQLLDRRQ
ncbi:MAG: PAS domain S-box protein [Duganella sp.]